MWFEQLVYQTTREVKTFIEVLLFLQTKKSFIQFDTVRLVINVHIVVVRQNAIGVIDEVERSVQRSQRIHVAKSIQVVTNLAAMIDIEATNVTGQHERGMLERLREYDIFVLTGTIHWSDLDGEVCGNEIIFRIFGKYTPDLINCITL